MVEQFVIVSFIEIKQELEMGIEVLKGQVMSSVVATDNTLTFTTVNGDKYEFYHGQDCCESVYIESIVGDLDDLVGHPILMVEEVTSHENPEWSAPASTESFTWTFYKFATIKGYVDVRWYGESNGYYSESVDFRKM